MNKKFNISIILTLLLIVAMLFTGCLDPNAATRNTATETPTIEQTVTPEPTAEVDYAALWLEMAEENLPEYIPLDILMSFDEYSEPQITDDGKKILYRHTDDTEDRIKIKDLQTGKVSNVRWPSGASGVPYYYVTPLDNKVLILMDDSGDENFGLYISDIETGESQTILPGGDYDCSFLGFNPSNDEECFIVIFDFDRYVYNLYRLNMVTFEMEPISYNNGFIINWIADTQGRFNLMMTMNQDASYDVWLRNDLNDTNPEFVESEWTKIITWDYEDADTSGVISYNDKTGNITIIDSSITNTAVVANYNIETKEKTIICQDSQGKYEAAGLWLDIETLEVTGVAYQREKLEWEGLTAEIQAHFDVLRQVAEGEFNLLTSSSDDRYWIVSYDTDMSATDYYLYDSATGDVTYLYNANPQLNDYEYAPMEPIEYTASDGLTIEGYATFPVNMDRVNLPLVVLIHGGPWSRDTWVFNSEVQFLANRGYMVLQVNFRGSTGYGKDFMLAGDREWGRAMHQDILDAIDWAIDQGWVDEDRVAAYGASYGGYESLICAAFDSDRFACAVDLFGPSSLLTLVSSQPPQWNIYSNNLFRSIGDPAQDEEEMKNYSPYYYAEDILIPLLVVQGGNDVRVTPRESEQLVEAMEEAGLDVDYIYLPNAGHGFSTTYDMMNFYSTAESFLAEHLGGRSRQE